MDPSDSSTEPQPQPTPAPAGPTHEATVPPQKNPPEEEWIVEYEVEQFYKE